MSIPIPCPKCGRVLKLLDRSFLGRKGQCSKCRHTFVLEEPVPATVELTEHEATSTSHPENPDIPPPPDFLLKRVAAGVEGSADGVLSAAEVEQPNRFPQDVDAVPALHQNAPVTGNTAEAPEPFVPADFSALEHIAKPKGTAAQLRELQKKNLKRRNIGFGITALILISVLIAVFVVPRFDKKSLVKDENGELGTEGKSSSIDSDGTDPGPDPATTTYASLGPPTHGKPIALQYMPFGPQIVLNLRPADLWKEGSLGEEIRFCIPPIANLIESTVQDLFKRKPDQIEELMICLIPGERGTMPEIAAVAHMVQEQKKSELIDQFGERIDKYKEPIYVSGTRAYMIPDLKTVVVCPKSLAEEMVQAIDRSHPADQIDPLLPITDRDRHVTILFTPLTLSLQDSWFPENVRPFVKNSLDWLGEGAESVSWSFHLTDELFYSEILLKNRSVLPKKKSQKMMREFKGKLAKLAEVLVPVIEQMNPKEQGKRMIIGRVPAMAEVYSMATIPHYEPRYLQFVTPLPDRAAPNLFLGTLLAWDESTRTDFSKAKPVPSDGPKLPLLVADRLALKIAVDFRDAPFNEAFSFIGGEINTSIEIDGDSLKLGGFTKNIKQTFKMDSATVQQIIVRIFEESKGVQKDPAKNLVFVVDEAKKKIIITTSAGAEKKGLKPMGTAG